MGKPIARQLRGHSIPHDVFAFIDSNAPSLLVKLLEGYIRELEKERDAFMYQARDLSQKLDELTRSWRELDHRVKRLEGERIMDPPVNTQLKPEHFGRITTRSDVRNQYGRKRR